MLINNANRKISYVSFNSTIWVITLCLMNFCNYVDRYSVAGILGEIQTYYEINNTLAGFLQTVFTLFYMICAPFCGFLADRYNRKVIIIAGLSIWSITVGVSSFIPSSYFWLFLLLRGLVGIGEASYSICAPTIISDLFGAEIRSRVLMIFYFAVPIGSGAAYMFGQEISTFFGDWKWSFRFTPFFALFLIFILIFVLREPNRRAHNVNDTTQKETRAKHKFLSSYLADIKYLINVKSYLWLCTAYSLMMFCIGSISWWVPTGLEHGRALNLRLDNRSLLLNEDKKFISHTFGIITTCSGIVGIYSGVFLARIWKNGRYCFANCASSKADAYVSAAGSFMAVPAFFLAYFCLKSTMTVSWVFIAIGILSLSLNWAAVVDMIMLIIVPEHRNVAAAWFFTTSHLFGDASGPFIIGLISDRLRDDFGLSPYLSLYYCFHALNVLLTLSGIAFLLAAWTAPKHLSRKHANRTERTI